MILIRFLEDFNKFWSDNGYDVRFCEITKYEPINWIENEASVVSLIREAFEEFFTKMGDGYITREELIGIVSVVSADLISQLESYRKK